jgi:hypothetical protein
LAAENHHIIGVFAADIRVPGAAARGLAGFDQNRADPLSAGYFCLNDTSIAPS